MTTKVVYVCTSAHIPAFATSDTDAASSHLDDNPTHELTIRVVKAII